MSAARTTSTEVDSISLWKAFTFTKMHDPHRVFMDICVKLVQSRLAHEGVEIIRHAIRVARLPLSMVRRIRPIGTHLGELNRRLFRFMVDRGT